MLKIFLTRAQCGMTGFESPAAQYSQSGLNLDQYKRCDVALASPCMMLCACMVGDIVLYPSVVLRRALVTAGC